MFLHNLVEKSLIQNLLRLEACIMGTPGSSRKRNYFIGFRKGVYVLDLERSLWTYFKALNVVRGFKKKGFRLLFIGSPFGVEKTLKRVLSGLHFFLSSKEWYPGGTSNTKKVQKEVYLVIFYSQGLPFLSNECFIKGIPFIGFFNSLDQKSFVDFPIFLNLHSRGSTGLFLYLVNQSMDYVSY
jgi:ribosomal protein S2